MAVNPYRRLPIYTKNVISKFRGKRRAEMPPHLFSVADNAYSNMLQGKCLTQMKFLFLYRLQGIIHTWDQ